MILDQEFLPSVVVLSYVTSFLGAAIAIVSCEQLRLSMIEHAYTTGEQIHAQRSFIAHKRKHFGYILMVALSISAVGIWGMHFIGMHALRLYIPAGYGDPEPQRVEMTFNVPLSFVSFIAVSFMTLLGTVIASYDPMFSKTRKEILDNFMEDAKSLSLAEIRKISARRILWVISTKSISRLVIGGIITGSGISVMHYIGMASMQYRVRGVEGVIVYSPGIVFASVIFAMLAATIAFWVLFRLLSIYPNRDILRLASASALAVAVCGMHYMGMVACTFESVDDHGVHYNTNVRPWFMSAENSFTSCLVASNFVLWVLVFLLLQHGRQQVVHYQKMMRQADHIVAKLAEKTLLPQAMQREDSLSMSSIRALNTSFSENYRAPIAMMQHTAYSRSNSPSSVRHNTTDTTTVDDNHNNSNNNSLRSHHSASTAAVISPASALLRSTSVNSVSGLQRGGGLHVVTQHQHQHHFISSELQRMAEHYIVARFPKLVNNDHAAAAAAAGVDGFDPDDVDVLAFDNFWAQRGYACPLWLRNYVLLPCYLLFFRCRVKTFITMTLFDMDDFSNDRAKYRRRSTQQQQQQASTSIRPGRCSNVPSSPKINTPNIPETVNEVFGRSTSEQTITQPPQSHPSASSLLSSSSLLSFHRIDSVQEHASMNTDSNADEQDADEDINSRNVHVQNRNRSVVGSMAGMLYHQLPGWLHHDNYNNNNDTRHHDLESHLEDVEVGVTRQKPAPAIPQGATTNVPTFATATAGGSIRSSKHLLFVVPSNKVAVENPGRNDANDANDIPVVSAGGSNDNEDDVNTASTAAAVMHIDSAVDNDVQVTHTHSQVSEASLSSSVSVIAST